MTNQTILAICSTIEDMNMSEINSMRETITVSLLSDKEKFYLYDALDEQELKLAAKNDNIAICSEFKEDDIK